MLIFLDVGMSFGPVGIVNASRIADKSTDDVMARYIHCCSINWDTKVVPMIHVIDRLCIAYGHDC